MQECCHSWIDATTGAYLVREFGVSLCLSFMKPNLIVLLYQGVVVIAHYLYVFYYFVMFFISFQLLNQGKCFLTKHKIQGRGLDQNSNPQPCLKRIFLLDTSAFSAFEVFDDNRTI